MLNSDTKRKIQTLRDILVGKIPTPTGQVEQITLALIYKFMSDIDTENEKDFGKKTFFVDTGTEVDQQFAQYHWANIMKSTNTAQQRLELYAQGLEKMNKNPNLSETFRNIFKGAFLPYRDPAILNLFLKGVNEIEYSHSEELGNAFEFLLSVMAAQGDAGQFRTPRHIIDFIVKVVDPQKDDTILDPACGTAGFLISAYKHILAQNTDPKIGKPGSALTTKERQQLPHNITGYDVSHEMVRLSLANMFLHLFPNPQIFEYDSLSDDSRWNDEFSCVLANPPFMTPKGGIKPHKRFQILANRAEVLFVDYIMEHLTTNGKAGIIVPEGIIFQSGKAYKALRKMMVEDNLLWAVVSLPSGVFNPYAGVKTSILLFDKELAKKSDSVYFVKLENDGYDLGAQRRPIEKNDLPGAYEVLKNLKSEIGEGKEGEAQDQSIMIKASKEAIRKDGDYNLSGERYRNGEVRGEGKWPMVELGEVCNFTQGVQISKDEQLNNEAIGYVRYLYIQDFKKENKNIYVKDIFKSKKVTENDLVMANTGTPGKVFLGKKGILSNNLFKITFHREKLLQKYLFYLLDSDLFQQQLQTQMKGGLQKHLGHVTIALQKIPLPPMNIQQQIVTELDRYQAIIDGARKVVENWKPQIEIDPTWEKLTIADLVNRNIISKPLDGNHGEIHPKASDYVKQGVPFIMANDLIDGDVDLQNSKKIAETQAAKLRKGFAKNGDVLLTHKGTIGRTAILKTDQDFVVLTPQVTYYRIIDKTILLSEFLKIYFDSPIFQNRIQQLASIGATRAYIGITDQLDLEIILPPIDVQQSIVEKIETENKIIQACNKMKEIYSQKIKDKINEVWNQK